jgi:hypothetical protein
LRVSWFDEGSKLLSWVKHRADNLDLTIELVDIHASEPPVPAIPLADQGTRPPSPKFGVSQIRPNNPIVARLPFHDGFYLQVDLSSPLLPPKGLSRLKVRGTAGHVDVPQLAIS